MTDPMPELMPEPIKRTKARLSPRQREVLDFLWCVRRRGTTLDRIVDVVYQNDPTGGPLSAKNNASVCLSKLRLALRGSGFHIPYAHLGPLRLVPGEDPYTRRRKAPRRRISIPLPVPVYHRLRDGARARNLDVPEFAARVLENAVNE